MEPSLVALEELILQSTQWAESVISEFQIISTVHSIPMPAAAVVVVITIHLQISQVRVDAMAEEPDVVVPLILDRPML
jgi:hypothetical protein